MKITVSSETDGHVFGIDIPNTLTLEDFRAYVEAETGIPTDKQLLIHNSKTLQDANSPLKDLGIGEDDLIVLRTRDVATNATSSTSQTADPNDRIELIRQQALNDPAINEQLRANNPQMHSLLHDPEGFKQALLQMMPPPGYAHAVQQEELRRLQAAPDDPENQEKIMKLIRQQQIEENLQLAYDISPESFVPVNMLYIKIRINGHEAYGLVDSGAQTTIISPQLAEKFGISNLIDDRYSVEARGIGTQKSKGRIHSVPVSIGETNQEIPCTFTVIDVHVGILFGLDMLRRHKCSIDLSKDALVIGDTETKFLTEQEIEKYIQIPDAPTGHMVGGPVAAAPSVPSSGQVPEAQRLNAAQAAQRRQNNAAPSAQGATSAGGFPEASIAQLTSLGFTREESVSALEQTNGNIELAASLLFL